MNIIPYTPEQRKLLIGHFFHFYQPERRGHIGPGMRLPELGHDGIHFRLMSDINYKIAMESYFPVFLRKDMERVLQHSVITFFPSLRYWFEKAYPPGELSGWSSFNSILFDKIRSLPAPDYHVLSGPPIHIIMPLLPDEDIRTVFEMMRLIDREDFGFIPKGLFCPEMAVDARTLTIAAEVGYEYVPLRDYQVHFEDQTRQAHDGRVGAVNNACRIEFETGHSITAILVDSYLSGQMAFNRAATVNADNHLDWLRSQPEMNKLSAMDGETIGHHIQLLDMFFARLHAVLETKGFLPMEVKHMLADSHLPKASVKSTSWSCEHGFSRWTGECDCDHPSHEVRHNKRVFARKLLYYNGSINVNLDAKQPGWRAQFKDLFVRLRKKILTGDNYIPDLEESISDQKYLVFMTAKFAVMIGLTSCGTFFAHKNGVERRIPQAAIQVIELLQPQLKEQFYKEYPDLYEVDENTGQRLPENPQFDFIS